MVTFTSASFWQLCWPGSKPPVSVGVKSSQRPGRGSRWAHGNCAGDASFSRDATTVLLRADDRRRQRVSNIRLVARRHHRQRLRLAMAIFRPGPPPLRNPSCHGRTHVETSLVGIPERARCPRQQPIEEQRRRGRRWHRCHKVQRGRREFWPENRAIFQRSTSIPSAGGATGGHRRSTAKL